VSNINVAKIYLFLPREREKEREISFIFKYLFLFFFVGSGANPVGPRIGGRGWRQSRFACRQFLDAGGNVSGTGPTAHGSWFQNRGRRAYLTPALHTQAPLRRGLFLCRTLGNHLPRSGFALVRKKRDLPQHDETKASLRRGFFCTEKGALNSSVAEVLKRQTPPQPIIALCQMRRCRTGSWFRAWRRAR
jgi:hypothetical protein